MGAGGRGPQSATLFRHSVCFAPSHVGDHGGRCCMARTGTNVRLLYLRRKCGSFQCAASAPYQPASATKGLMAGAHS